MTAKEIEKLESYLHKLSKIKSKEATLAFLEELDEVKAYFNQAPTLHNMWLKLDLEAKIAVASLLALGQGPIAFHGFSESQTKDFLPFWTILKRSMPFTL